MRYLRTINLEEGFPTRQQARQRLESAIGKAKKDGLQAVKLIHGYGSSGQGGTLRFAVRGYLRQMKDRGEISLFVNGETFSQFEERSRELMRKVPELILDQDLGAGNKGVTLVLLI
jgi:Smr domain-containing protein